TVVTVAGPAGLAPLLLPDNTLQPGAGKAALRFVQTLASAPPMLANVQQGASGTAMNLPIGLVAFGMKGDYVELDSGRLRLVHSCADTQQPVLDLRTVQLDDATSYSIFLVGSSGAESGLDPLMVVDGAGS